MLIVYSCYSVIVCTHARGDKTLISASCIEPIWKWKQDFQHEIMVIATACGWLNFNRWSNLIWQSSGKASRLWQLFNKVLVGVGILKHGDSAVPQCLMWYNQLKQQRTRELQLLDFSSLEEQKHFYHRKKIASWLDWTTVETNQREDTGVCETGLKCQNEWKEGSTAQCSGATRPSSGPIIVIYLKKASHFKSLY